MNCIHLKAIHTGSSTNSCAPQWCHLEISRIWSLQKYIICRYICIILAHIWHLISSESGWVNNHFCLVINFSTFETTDQYFNAIYILKIQFGIGNALVSNSNLAHTNLAWSIPSSFSIHYCIMIQSFFKNWLCRF